MNQRPLLNTSSVIYFLSAALALTAGNMVNYALIIYVRRLTNSDGITGLLFLTLTAPTLLLTPKAGVLLDSRSRRGVLAIFQSIMGVCVMGLAALAHLGVISNQAVYPLFIAAAINGATYAFIIPARMTILANLVGQEHISRATILVNVLVIAGFGLAPLFVGAIKEYHDYNVVFLVIGLLVIMSVLLLIPLRTVKSQGHSGGMQFRVGLRFIREDGLVRELLIFGALVLIMAGPAQVLLPEFARRILELGEQERGAFLSMLGLGLFAGGVFAGIRGAGLGRGRWMPLMLTAIGIMLGGLTLSHSVIMAGAFLLGAGLLTGLLTSIVPAALQSNTPDHVRGRVMSVYTMLLMAVPAFSGMLCGLLSDFAGLTPVLLGVSVFIVVCGLAAAFFLARLRGFELHQSRPQQRA